MPLVPQLHSALSRPLNFFCRYDDQVPLEFRYPPMFVFDSMMSYKAKIGLWIDLCNTSRFYDRKAVEELGAKYVKLQCSGYGETPSQEQVPAATSHEMFSSRVGSKSVIFYLLLVTPFPSIGYLVAHFHVD